MGYIGTRLLADRDRPGDYMMLADFAEVDGDLTAADEAEPNNRREAMERWAEKLRVLVDGETSRVAFLQESLGTVGGVIRCHQILGQVGYVLRFEPPP